MASRELDSPMRQVPFYIDSYAVRALAVAYDMTGEPRYLDACRTWSRKMIRYQKQMNPPGAYYMNYGRKPGQTEGNWYVADSSSIAMGVLATAARCADTSERRRGLGSVLAFARLVTNNFVGPNGGICNVHRPRFAGEWWCCSGLFGSLCFLLYGETGEPRYRDLGLGTIRWLNAQELSSTGPYDLRQMGPTLPMYFFEAYSAGWPHLAEDPELRTGAARQFNVFLQWASTNVPATGDSTAWPYASQWGSKFAGLPFHLFVRADDLAEPERIRAAADRELARLWAVFATAPTLPRLSQLQCFAMLSMAERLSPGSLYRPSRRSHYASPHAR